MHATFPMPTTELFRPAEFVLEVFRQAVRYHQGGELNRAAVLCQVVLDRDPEHADALHLLGLVALQKGDCGRAVTLIWQAVAIDPVAVAYHCNLGEAYRLLGQLEQAGSCFRTALMLRPGCAEAALGLGLVLAAQGETEAALAMLRAAVADRPGAPADLPSLNGPVAERRRCAETADCRPGNR
jgi:Flp pilus assembly protein TadD